LLNAGGTPQYIGHPAGAERVQRECFDRLSMTVPFCNPKLVEGFVSFAVARLRPSDDYLQASGLLLIIFVKHRRDAAIYWSLARSRATAKRECFDRISMTDTFCHPELVEGFVTLSLSKGTPFSMTNCDFPASQNSHHKTCSIIKNPTSNKKSLKSQQSCQIVFNFAAL
jgi:hypothetical protein